VRSLPGTWRDLGGDYEYDDGPEKRFSTRFSGSVSAWV